MVTQGSTGRSRGGTPPAKSTARQGAQAAKQTTGAAKRQAGLVASTAADEGQEVASTAVEQVSEVVETAKGQASKVTDEVSNQAQRLLEETKSRVQTEAQTQTDQLVTRLRDLGQEATALGSGRSPQGDTVQGYLRQAGERLTTLAEDLDSRGVEGLVGDAQDFARRRPAAFLAGAGVAGFLAARFVRGVNAQSNRASSGNGRAVNASGTRVPQAMLRSTTPSRPRSR